MLLKKSDKKYILDYLKIFHKGSYIYSDYGNDPYRIRKITGYEFINSHIKVKSNIVEYDGKSLLDGKECDSSFDNSIVTRIIFISTPLSINGKITISWRYTGRIKTITPEELLELAKEQWQITKSESKQLKNTGILFTDKTKNSTKLEKTINNIKKFINKLKNHVSKKEKKERKRFVNGIRCIPSELVPVAKISPPEQKIMWIDMIK